MRRIAALLAVMAPVAACGSLKDEVSRAASQPAHELLYVATSMGTSVVDASTDSLVASLPPGTLLPDRSRYWTVDSGDRTAVRGLDPATGLEQVSFTLDGRWAVPTSYGPAPSGISANGKWMVLVAPPVSVTGSGTLNRFAMIDLANKKLDRIVTANGDVSFAAASDDPPHPHLLENHHPAPKSDAHVPTLHPRAKRALRHRLAPAS